MNFFNISNFFPSNSQNRLKRLITFCIFSVLLLATLIASKEAEDARSLIPSNVDSYYLPSGKFLRFASMGNTRMLADLVWVKTLMYFGTELMGNARQTWLSSYLDTIFILDPNFRNAYLWAGAAMMYNGRIIDNELIEQSNKFYRMGLSHFPNSWKMASSLGFNYAYELKPKDKKSASYNHKEALKWFLKAAKSPDSPPYIKAFALNQMDKEGLRVMAVNYVKRAFAQAKSDSERKYLEKKMKTLLNSKDIDKWKMWQKNFEEGYNKYLPFGTRELYILLGPPDSIDD